ncbi:hypothetical protein PMAC_002382 [Pneumocystis sp. 'macacae']|nr:hypothetical protein PMAC_002382 [Pneumocystis sp. 'macacae']
MVNFVALNTPPETAIDIENHTKEVQIETGLKLYQRALSLQHAKDWSAAAKVYEELLSLDILKSSSIEELCNVTSERMIRLIYLVYKNYGSFVFDTLISSDSNDDHGLSMLYTCLKNYSIALKYDHDDLALWMKVSEVSENLGLNRIFRFSLESIISSEMELLIDREYSVDRTSYGNILSPEIYKSLIKLNSTSYFDMKIVFQEKKFVNLQKKDSHFQNSFPLILKVPERNIDSISITLASSFLNRYERNDFEFYSHIEFIENQKHIDKCLSEVNDTEIHESQIIVTLQNDFGFSEMFQELSTDIDNSRIFLESHSDINNLNDLESESFQNKIDNDNIDSLKNFKKRHLNDENYEKSLRVSKRIRDKDGINLNHEEKDICFVNSLNEIFSKVDMYFGEYSTFICPPADIFFENNVIDKLRQSLYCGFLTEDAINDVIQEKSFSMFPRVFYLDLSKHLDISVNINGNENLTVIDEFESFINSDKYSLDEISLEWFKRITFYSYSDLGTLYFQKKWSSRLSNAVIQIAINVEIECLCFFKNVLKKKIFCDNYTNDAISMEIETGIIQVLGWAQTILELFLNYYVKNERNDYFEKTETDELIFQKQRICRWRLLVNDLMLAYGVSFDSLQTNNDMINLLLRHKFCNAIILEYFGALHESVIKEYQYIKDYMLQLGNVSVIYFPNCEVISEISLFRIDLEISKLKTVDFFTSVFVSSRLMEYNLVIEKLRPVLQGSSELNEIFKFSLVEEFLLKAPIDFKLQLWNLLQNAYHNLSQVEDALWCCLKALSSVISYFDSSFYKNVMTEQQMTIFILKRLFSASQLISYALQSLVEHDKILSFLSNDVISESLSSFLVILRLLLIFCFFEDSIVDNNSCTPKFSNNEIFDNKLHNMQVQSWCFAYCLYKEILLRKKTDTSSFYTDITKFLCLIHEELGIRGYCSLSDGVLLRILQTELLNSGSFSLTSEIIQCLHCRFGLSFGTENFYPFDHYTEPSDIDCFSAEQILPFILSLINKRRSGLTLPRADIKTVLDRIYNVLENAPNSKVSNAFNFALISAYLSENIRLNDIIGCQYDSFALALSDVNFVQAEIHISMFRSRGKTTSTRGTDDLQLALKYLMADLSLNPWRMSSWHALGLTFGWLSDDELTWSAEYIYNEQKSISDLRKKSLKAYMMAFSFFISSFDNDMNDNLVYSFSNLQYDFGLQLYTSVHPPLDMEPFISRYSQFYNGPDGLLKRELTNDVSYHRIIELSMKCFLFASKNNGDWRCFYMLGKTLGKLKRDPKQVLDQYLCAIKLVPRKNTVSGQAIIIEPDYKLLETAMMYLREIAYDNDISELETPVKKDDIIEICLIVLKRIRLADKKHWHHRPVFRCAKILESQFKIQSAKDELETLFSIRTFGKAVINIWRPDFERFVLLLKRLRKVSSSIYHHRYVWENLCTVYLNLLRRNASIPECPSMVWDIPLSKFNFIATKFEEQFLNNTISDEYGIDNIRDVLELKKINGGLFNVEIIDQFLIDIYFNIYLSFSKEIDIMNNSLVNIDNILKRKNISNDLDDSNSYANTNNIYMAFDGAINNNLDNLVLINDNFVLVSRKDVLSRLSFFSRTK